MDDKKTLLNEEQIIFDLKEMELNLNNLQARIKSFNSTNIKPVDIPVFKDILLNIYNMLKDTGIYKQYHSEELKPMKKEFLDKYKQYSKENIGYLMFTKILDSLFTKLEKLEDPMQRASYIITNLCQFVPIVLYSIGEDIPEGEFNYSGKIKIYKDIEEA